MHAVFAALHGHVQSNNDRNNKNLQSLAMYVPSWSQIRLLSAFFFQLWHCKLECLFHDLLSAMFFSFLCFFCWQFLSLKWPPPQAWFWALSIVLKLVKAMMCPKEKIHMLDKFHSSNMSCSAIGHEFNANMNCCPPGCSVHGILQARILE